MAVKKSELYSSLWQSCDQLRGGMDASQYKDYVLTLLFVKYVSDKYAGNPYGLITVPKGGSFADMAQLKGDKEIGDKMNKIVGALAEANRLQGVIDLADFNDEDKLGKGKAMVDRLSNLVGIFEKLDLRANRVGGDDLLGDAYGRFQVHGVPPARNGDYAFLLHIIASLKSDGRAAVILPHGVLFRGNAEADIRRSLLKHGLLEAVIGLPPNLFYGTGIPACILVIDKGPALPQNGAAQNGLSGDSASPEPGVFMVDASRGFMKDGNKNRLRARDLHKIVDVFTRWQDAPGYARFVPKAEIAANDYNLNIPRYIDATDDEDLHDLDAHLNGGIPRRDIDALQAFWTVFPTLRADLFAPGREGYSRARVPARAVKAAILKHPDFQSFAGEVAERTAGWRAAHEPTLRALSVGADPKALIHTLSEDLLHHFEGAPLLDRYALYQRLMDFWAQTMQDDVFVIAQDGWAAGQTVRPAHESETPDFSLKQGRKTVGYVGELIPAQLLIEQFFPEEQAALERLHGELDEAQQALDEYEEEHSAEGAALDGLEGSRGVTKGNVQDRVQELKEAALEAFDEGTPRYKQAYAITKTNFGTRDWAHGVVDPEDLFLELDVLYEYLRLYDDVTTQKGALKEATADLYEAVMEKYPALSEAQIKDLVVEAKWLRAVQEAVRAEVERVTQRLAGRIETLEARYADPLPQLERAAKALARDVDAHLEAMGVGVDEE